MTEKEKLFVAAYEANFGLWPAMKRPEQASIWFDWVRYLPENRIANIVESFAETWEQRGSPTLRHFKAWWKENGPRREGPPIQRCALCYGRGLIAVPSCVTELPDGRKAIHFEAEAGALWDTAWPCRCSAGDRWARSLNVSQTVRDQANMVWADYRKAAGHQVELEPITREQYLDLTISSQSPENLMRQYRIDSYRIAGLIEEQRKYRPPGRGTSWMSASELLAVTEDGFGRTEEAWREMHRRKQRMRYEEEDLPE